MDRTKLLLFVCACALLVSHSQALHACSNFQYSPLLEDIFDPNQIAQVEACNEVPVSCATLEDLRYSPGNLYTDTDGTNVAVESSQELCDF